MTDVPIEVTLTDGSAWIIYYRLDNASYARALEQLKKDVTTDRWMPADDLDGVQRRFAAIRLSQVVSARQVDG